MDMSKEQSPILGKDQPSGQGILNRRGFFGSIVDRFTGNSSPGSGAEGNSLKPEATPPISTSESKDTKLNFNRRDFIAAAGAAATVFATNPEKAVAQLGGTGPDGAPPPDVSDPNTPLPDNRSPEAREAREAYLLPIEFLHDYKGKDQDVEEAARGTFVSLFGMTSEVSRVIPALQTLNDYMANQDNPNKNIKDGYHLVQGLGPDNKYGGVSVGVIAFNPGIDMGLAGVNPNRPLSIVRRIQTYKKTNQITNQPEDKILLDFLVVIGVPKRELMNPDNIGLIVENVLRPYNGLVADKRACEGAIAEMLSKEGVVDVEKLKSEFKDTNSELNTNVKIEAWRNTLEPLDDILSTGNWRVDPDLRRFHDGYKALRPQEGDSPEIRDQKLKDMKDYLRRGPN